MLIQNHSIINLFILSILPDNIKIFLKSSKKLIVSDKF